MVPVYLDADGRTAYTLDGRGGRVDFGEALFGRGAEVIGARGGVAECLAAAAADLPPLRGVALADSTPQPDGTHLVCVKLGAPTPDLAVENAALRAENAALRAALATSGELLAEAHAEVDQLRGAR